MFSMGGFFRRGWGVAVFVKNTLNRWIIVVYLHIPMIFFIFTDKCHKR